MLLAAAAGEPLDSIARLTVGQRDARLLWLREWAFGSQVAATADCPGCNERLELNFLTSDIRLHDGGAESAESLPLEIEGYALRFRAPNSLDLLAIGHDPQTARRQLLERCFSEITHHETAIRVDQLPAEILSRAVERIAEADPQGDVRIGLNCPLCGHQWEAVFDIGPFFWSEIQTWAQRILREVHVLASAYGWRETDILMMSPRRRQFYLDCIR
jgi:hypothetical protein